MTQPLNFTSIAPAPVGCLLDCAKTGDAANNLKLARAIDVELDGRGSEQHVKIKVGTLRVLVESIQSLDKLSASLEAALDERREELIEVRDGLIEWRTYAMRLLANSFMTYPTSETVDDNLRIMITASIEHEQRKLKVVSKERDELRNTANAADQLRKAAELERDDVIHLNRNAAEEIQRLSCQLNEWHDWATDVICSPSSMEPEAQRTAITQAMRKRKERIESLEGIVKDVVSQRDAWVIWAREFADAPAGLHTTEQLISMVQGKVKAGTQHTFQGTLKVTKPKEDALLTSRGWCKMQDGNVTIQNAVIASGSTPASKVTFSDEMKAAIREVIRDEIADLNKAVVDILSKMPK
nr:MAG: hypothetical protein [Bacteriophage sp.]